MKRKECDESMFSEYVNVWDFGKCVVDHSQ